MDINQVKQIIEKLGQEFDTHAFINEFMNEFEKEYVEMLARYKDSSHRMHNNVNAGIGRYLLNHSSELKISPVAKGVSASNKGGNLVENQIWVKK